MPVLFPPTREPVNVSPTFGVVLLIVAVPVNATGATASVVTDNPVLVDEALVSYVSAIL